MVFVLERTDIIHFWHCRGDFNFYNDTSDIFQILSVMGLSQGQLFFISFHFLSYPPSVQGVKRFGQ